MLFVSLLASLAAAISACLYNDLYNGTLALSLRIEAVTMWRPASTCSCCGLCHQRPGCKSFSFSPSGECALYTRVGGFSDFSREAIGQHGSGTQFFFMPNSSTTDEFCRSDSDCVTPGDSCRGRLCTANTTVTCRSIYDTNSALPEHRYWGFVDGRELLFYCLMNHAEEGFTLLLVSYTAGSWTAENRLNYTQSSRPFYPNRNSRYSALWAADAIRDSREGDTYEVLVIGTRVDKSGTDDRSQWRRYIRAVKLTVPRGRSILAREPSPVRYTVRDNYNFGFPDSSQVSVPYLVERGGILYHMSMDRYSQYGSLIRQSGGLGWSPPAHPANKIQLFIRP